MKPEATGLVYYCSAVILWYLCYVIAVCMGEWVSKQLTEEWLLYSKWQSACALQETEGGMIKR